MKQIGLLLTIDGLPCAFATQGVDLSFLPTGSSDFPTGITSGSVYKFLVDAKTGNYSWDEDLKFTEGDFEGGSITFKIVDAKATINGSARNVASYYFTRTNQETIPLSADYLSTQTTMSVSPPTSVITANQVVWIEGEAILLTGSVGASTLVAGTRGYYGTRASNHYTDTQNGYYPAVFADFPGIQNRRCLLWVCNGTAGNWFVAWRGIINRAPSANNNGAIIEIQADHFWTKTRDINFNIKQTDCKLAGTHPFHCSIGVECRRAGTYVSSDAYYLDSPGVESDSVTPQQAQTPLQVLAATGPRLYQRLRSSFSFGESEFLQSVASSRQGLMFRADFLTSIETPRARMTLGTHRYLQTEVSTSSDRKTVSVESDFLPTILNKVRINNNTTGYLVLDNIRGLPSASNWIQTGSYGDNAYTRDCVRFPYEEEGNELDVFFFPQTTLSGSGYTPSKLKGTTQIVQKKVVDPAVIDRITRIDGQIFFYYPTPVQVGKHIWSTSWSRAFRHGIIERTTDSRNWDFSNFSALNIATNDEFAQTQWFLTNNDTIKSIIAPHLKFRVCAIAPTTNGKLNIVNIRKPLLTDSPVATFTYSSTIAATQWELSQDAIVNSFKLNRKRLDGGDFVLTVNDSFSKGISENFGRTLELDLANILPPISDVASTVTYLTNHLRSKFFAIFGRQFYTCTIIVPLITYINSVFPGNVVRLTDWLVPDGTGQRSVSAVRCVVMGRKPDLGNNTLALKLMLFPSDRRAAWAPCGRVSSITGTQVTLATNYLTANSENTDYAGSNLSSYTGTANDGGTSRFSAGDKVELILRNDTSYISSAHTISSVDPTTNRINLTVSPGATWETYASTGIVDIRYNAYDTSGIGSNQKEYAFDGDDTDGYIASSTDRAYIWSS